MIDLSSSLPLTIIAFVLGAVVIAVAGSQMAKLADRLADLTGLGEAFTGTIFLGLVTALPGLTSTITLAVEGRAVLTTNNALGGIALQTIFLAIADITYRKANLEHAAASHSNLIQTAILIFLLNIVLMAFIGPNITFWHIHPLSLVLFAATALGIFIVHWTRTEPMWRPHFTSQTVQDEPSKHSKETSLSRTIISFAIAAILVLFSGVVVAEAAQALADLTGLSETLVGGVFLAITTSLPELVTTIAAVRIGALTLAVADIVGGNFFDSLFLAIGDLFYTKGSIYHASEISPKEPFLAALCMILNMTLLIGLLVRQKEGPGKIGLESVLMLIFYACGFAGLYLF